MDCSTSLLPKAASSSHSRCCIFMPCAASSGSKARVTLELSLEDLAQRFCQNLGPQPYTLNSRFCSSLK